MDILFIRHGETEWNHQGRIQGGNAEIDINDRGIRQAELSRDGLVAAGWRFDRCFSSPFRRAFHTAEILSAPSGIAPVVDNRLHELYFGPYEGTSLQNFADENIRAAFRDPPRYVARDGGESFDDLGRRVATFLDETLRPLEGQAERILAVTHGGFLRALTRHFDRRPLSEFWKVDRQPNCCAYHLTCQGGTFSLVRRAILFYDLSIFGEYRSPV